MGKKKRSSAQLAADRARSEKMKAKLAVDSEAPVEPSTASEASEVDDGAKVNSEDISVLVKRIQELEARQFFTPAVQEAVRAITKYSLNPSDWPDPRKRLAEESRLQRHAFKENFILEWDVGKVQYQKDGVNYTEPKFRLELWKWLEDPKSGELTTKKFRVHKVTFFEDPDAAVQIATDNGVEVDSLLQKPFLDEMRYLRVRDWLLEIFYPAPIKQSGAPREEIIGNRLVPVIETSSAEPIDIMSRL